MQLEFPSFLYIKTVTSILIPNFAINFEYLPNLISYKETDLVTYLH